jgi:hypothetical protein
MDLVKAVSVLECMKMKWKPDILLRVQVVKEERLIILMK